MDAQMSKSSAHERTALQAFDPQTYMDTVAPMIVGAPHAAYREGVLANLATAHAMAKVVFAVELDADSCDLAGVFTPQAAEPLTSQDT
jgi:1,4-dihydroxy-2-naphthoate octaprenyltransferase